MGIIEKVKNVFKKEISFDESKKTVFDYDITEEEWQHITSLPKEYYMKYANQVDFDMDIATLFWIRGEKKKAIKYSERLPLKYRNDWLRTMTHP